MKKSFVLIDSGSESEVQMIGVVSDIANTEDGIKSFKDRFILAIKEHFCVSDVNNVKLPDLFSFCDYFDVTFEADGDEHKVRITETWLY